MGRRGSKRKYKILVGDFETTVYEGQDYTEVWASALVPLYTEDVVILHSIGETFNYLKGLKENLIVYYHNLKFDGAFWLDFLLRNHRMKPAFETGTYTFESPDDMPNNTYKYVVSARGQWYVMYIKINNKIIELRDSLKLLPFSVKVLGEAFKTKHRKLSMEYEGLRYAGCNITPEEQKYIANDVLVVKEALEAMYAEGHNKLTIGACCMEEFIRTMDGKDGYRREMPDLTKVELDANLYDYSTVDAYLRRSYRGGWCYVVKGKENHVYINGSTGDVNSLYPSMMSSESGNEYPVGLPVFWKGDYIPKEAKVTHRYYFIRIRTRFYIKKDMLPFIQIKGSPLYSGTEMLETSDVLIDRSTDRRVPYYIDADGNVHDTRVTMTMTMTDYILFREHYNVYDFEILDGCYFRSRSGMFDEYINKYRKIKQESKGAKRTLAKLFLNNLYGQMAKSDDSSYKIAFLKDGKIQFMDIKANEKTAGYMPIGSAITSYARNFTIRAAQKNYHGNDKRGFIYADTDSIHCDLAPDEMVGIKIDEKAFCCWKIESCWDKGIFVRQKTYMERIVQEDEKPVENPYWNIKCAGMPETCKSLLRRSMAGDLPNDNDNEDAKIFLAKKRTINDFKVGLKVPNKLMPKRIKGGILLVNSFYEMRG